MNKDELIESINKRFEYVFIDGFSRSYLPAMKEIIQSEIEKFFKENIREIDRQIQFWEHEMSGEDKGLYALGLRQVKELILESNPFITKD